MGLKSSVKKFLPKGFVRRVWFKLNQSKDKETFIFNYSRVYKNENAYDKYLEIQKNAFERKIDNQWETEENINNLSNFLIDRFNNQKIEGICHGTRTGSEQAWFNKRLGNDSYVFGTDIGTNLEQYKDTIYFDMNKDNREWKNKFHFVYSNSWDHSYEPDEMLINWVSHLKEGGIIILNHTATHNPNNFASVSETDPVAISSKELTSKLNNLGLKTFTIEGVPRNNDSSLMPWIYVCGEKLR